MFAGEDCVDVVADLGYEGSAAERFDPLSVELSSEATCDVLNNEIATLASLGNNSEIDALRFSYEVSFTTDNDERMFDRYMSCIEMNARENPLATCVDLMNEKPTHFAMLNGSQKETICASVATDSEGKDDVCGFIVVSAYQVYNDFYKGLESETGTWIIDKLGNDLDAVKEDGYSESG